MNGMYFRRVFWRVRPIRDWGTRAMHTLRGRRCIHFLHVGKTGGTAIKHALHRYQAVGESAVILHRHGFRVEDVPRGEKYFFFLRDPVSRFTSGFLSRRRQGRPTTFVPWSRAERAAFEEFDTPNQLALALGSPHRAERHTAQAAMTSIFHVRQPFSYWLGDTDHFLSRRADLLFIGLQETLSDDLDRIKRLIGLPATCTLPTASVSSHRNPRPEDAALEVAAVENVKAWYQKDYEFLALARAIRREEGWDEPMEGDMEL
jgi:hypothetical protein